MIDYLIVYVLGIVTPITFQRVVVPKIKRWLKNKAEKWD